MRSDEIECYSFGAIDVFTLIYSLVLNVLFARIINFTVSEFIIDVILDSTMTLSH